MILATGEEPDSGFSPQAVPVSAEFREQLGAEHDVAVLASLATLDVYDHALGIDVADFQVGEFGAAGPGSVEGQ